MRTLRGLRFRVQGLATQMSPDFGVGIGSGQWLLVTAH